MAHKTSLGPSMAKQVAANRRNLKRFVATANKRETKDWRNDALDKAAEIVRRHLGDEGSAIIADILALRRT